MIGRCAAAAGRAGSLLVLKQPAHTLPAPPAVGAPGDWSHILKQIGMFSYTGLTKVGVGAAGMLAWRVVCRCPAEPHLPTCSPSLHLVHHTPSTSTLQAQVENMTAKWHVYMTFDGRISMAGLSGTSRLHGWAWRGC